VPDEFVTVNEEIAARLRRRHRRLPVAVIVKNAIARPDHPVKSNGRLHTAIGLDPSQRLLLFHGGLMHGRGLEALVQAGPLLPKGWSVVLMGRGVQEHALRELAKRADPTGERIHFVPAVGYEVLLEWVAGATLGIIAYDNSCMNNWLCSPNKLWEFPGAGVPVIASPFPLLRRVVERNDIGWLLPDPITPAGIAETVTSINQHDLRRKQQNCRAFIAHDNWSMYEARLMECYERLLGRPKASSVPQSAERDPAPLC
jgi:glycosyltransferase involved in cell wall biosynthesis